MSILATKKYLFRNIIKWKKEEKTPLTFVAAREGPTKS